ncbi:MAG TPA: LptA/OstA family protein [Stellaceae bacterium]|nr:LptA/OstA family protein [Stellaceae bacterium]
MRHAGRVAALLLGLTVGKAVVPLPAQAQNFGLGLTTQDNNKPITIEADQGIEWQQNNHVYIARGHAKATRGQATVFGDVLVAYYRPVTPAGAGTSTPPAEHKAPGDSGDPIGGNSTEIYRLEATGNVRIATETQTVYGDHAVYDVDRTLLVVTGKNLRLETPRDTLTARDSLEWYDDKQLAVARGDAVAIREGKRLRGDVLTATVTRLPNESSHISRVDAQGNVLVSSQDQIARGDAGVYNVDTGIATLTGRVTLTRADNELRGQYAVVDLNNNVSRLLSAPPSTQLTAGKPARVQGLLIPRQKPATPAQ